MTTEIDKDKFENYVAVQYAGIANMMSREAREAANLTRDEHMEIINNYGKYAEKYPDVLEAAEEYL